MAEHLMVAVSCTVGWYGLWVWQQYRFKEDWETDWRFYAELLFMAGAVVAWISLIARWIVS